LQDLAQLAVRIRVLWVDAQDFAQVQLGLIKETLLHAKGGQAAVGAQIIFPSCYVRPLRQCSLKFHHHDRSRKRVIAALAFEFAGAQSLGERQSDPFQDHCETHSKVSDPRLLADMVA